MTPGGWSTRPSTITPTTTLAEGRPSQALWAAEKAIAAAPSEDKPRLDLARAKQAMGDDAAAQRYLRHEIFNRSDDDRAPLDPSARTAEVIDRIVGTAHADAAQDHALLVGSPIQLSWVLHPPEPCHAAAPGPVRVT